MSDALYAEFVVLGPGFGGGFIGIAGRAICKYDKSDMSAMAAILRYVCKRACNPTTLRG